MRYLPLCILLLGACATAQDEPPVVDANALRKDAFAAEARGDTANAAKLFGELAKAEPTEPNWVVRAADNLGKSGQFDDAMDLLDRARKQFPDVLSIPSMLARTYHLRADTLRAQGISDSFVVFLYQDAIRTAEQVLAIDPDQTDARLIVASAHYQLAEFDAALAAAELAIQKRPRDYGGHAMIGRICLQRFVNGKQALGSAELEPEAKAAVEAEIAASAARARTAFEAAAAADPSRAFPLAKLGDLAAWSGDVDGALDWYGKALVVDAKAQFEHGWLRTTVEAGKRRAFYVTAREAHAARPDATPQSIATIQWYEAQAIWDLAASAPATAPPAERNRLWKDAGDAFAATLEPLPDYVDTYWWMLQARYWGGDMAAAGKVAVQFARKAPRRFADMIRTDEQTVATLTGLAGAAYSDGRLADSRDLNLVLAYAYQTADAWNNYAFLCRETKQYPESLRAYEQALSIEPESPQLMNDAGVILQYHLADAASRERAQKLYEEAIRLAERQLASGDLEGEKLQMTRTALRDARANLAKLH